MSKISRKYSKIKYFMKSMRLHVFMVIVIAGLTSMTVLALSVRKEYKNKSLEIATEEISDYVKKLSLKIINNAYLTNSSNTPDITRELGIAGELYDGRLLVLDGRLRIVTDTYGIEDGKTLISEEAIRAVKGNKSEFRDDVKQRVELAIPIVDIYNKENGNKNVGAVIVNFSTEKTYSLLKVIDQRIILVLILFGLCIVAFAVIIARRMSQPFKLIIQSLHHVSEGYVDDKVEINGYSEMEKISDSFNEMLDRISMLEESRQEFVSNVSHELKTPITSIKVLADSLLGQQDIPVEVYREFLTDIDAEIDRESKIISDLLALVRLDKKTGDMHIAEVSLNELLEIILKRIKPIAQMRNIELVFESYRNVLAEIDEVKMSLALSNLIENAVKYNKENGWVRVSLNSDHKFFYIKVSDSGIGIPESAQARIFDRFYRVDKTRARESGGTGLGLSITKSVIMMHSGAIKVYSDEGEGTTFTIRVPISYIPNDI